MQTPRTLAFALLCASLCAVPPAARAQDARCASPAQRIGSAARASTGLARLLAAGDAPTAGDAPGLQGVPAGPSAPVSPASIEALLTTGLARFVVGRARQEALAFAVERLQRDMCRSAVAPLFASTCGLLAVSPGGQDGALGGRVLHRAAIADLDALPWRLATLLRDHAPRAPAPARASVRALAGALGAMDQLACGLEQGQSVLAVLAGILARDDFDAGIPATVPALIELAAAVFRDAGEQERRQWLERPDALARLLVQRLLVLVFLDHARLDRARPDRAEPDEARPGDLPAGTDMPALDRAGQHLIEAMGDALAALPGDPSAPASPVFDQAVDAAVATLRARARTQPALQAVLDALATDIDSLSPDRCATLLARVRAFYEQQMDPLLRQAVRMAAGVERLRQAGADRDQARHAVAEILDAGAAVLEAALATSTGASTGDGAAARLAGAGALRAASAFLAGDHTGGITALLAIPQIRTMPGGDALVRFGAVLVELTAARSSEDVAAVLERVAAPAGSWRARRVRPTWGISGRVGVGGGIESPVAGSGYEATMGLRVPIVIDAWRPHVLGQWPAGVGVQLIDLGTVATVRDTAGGVREAELGFAQLLSPGVTLSLGLGKTPLILSATAAWTPALRAPAGNTNDRASVWRYMLGLSFDVPLFLR